MSRKLGHVTAELMHSRTQSGSEPHNLESFQQLLLQSCQKSSLRPGSSLPNTHTLRSLAKHAPCHGVNGTPSSSVQSGGGGAAALLDPSQRAALENHFPLQRDLRDPCAVLTVASARCCLPPLTPHCAHSPPLLSLHLFFICQPFFPHSKD